MTQPTWIIRHADGSIIGTGSTFHSAAHAALAEEIEAAGLTIYQLSEDDIQCMLDANDFTARQEDVIRKYRAYRIMTNGLRLYATADMADNDTSSFVEIPAVMREQAEELAKKCNAAGTGTWLVEDETSPDARAAHVEAHWRALG